MIPALRDLDAAVHKNRDPAKLTSALKTAASKHAAPYDPVVRHLCNYVLHATTHEQAFERIQRAQAMYTSAVTQALATAGIKFGRHSVAVLGEDTLVSDALNKSQATAHVIGTGVGLKRRLFSYPPLAMRQALKHADMALIPGILVTPTKVIAPMGAELLADVCKQYGIPCYALTLGLRFAHHDEHLPQLHGAQPVSRKSGHRTVHQATYERIDPDSVSVISELGVFSHARFIDEVQHHYPWL